MQDPKKEKRSGDDGFEKALEPIHGILDRIHALEHPEWEQKNVDVSSLRAALARYSSDLEHLKYRYDFRGTELEKLKAQYTELEHKFLMRPEAMRRAGEMEVTELVKQKHDLAALENSLEKNRVSLEQEKDKLAAEAKELVAERLAALEKDYAAKNELLNSREERSALREKEVAEAEARFKEHIEDLRELTKEEVSAAFEHERATFRKEKTVLAADLEKWRLKAEESLSQLAGAKKAAADHESAAEAASEAAAEARQKCKLAEMERTACLKRLEEWEGKGPEFEKWRAELSIREESCRRIEENAGREAKPLRERITGLEDELRQAKHESEKRRLKVEEALSQLATAKAAVEDLQSAAEASEEALAEARQKCKLAEMDKAASLKRLEEWEKKGEELEKWRTQLSAREENCGRIEEKARQEAKPLMERIAGLEDGLRQEKYESEKRRLRAEELQSQLAAAKKTAEDLESAAEASNEAVADARQKCKLAEMDKTACLKRLEDWEKKGPEFENWRSDFEAKLKEENARFLSSREELKGVKEHLDRALKESAALEEELVLVKEQHLKAEAQRDAERSKKMESLLAETEEKERAMEDAWTRRHKALEAEQKSYHAEFEKRHLALLEDLHGRSAGMDKLYAQKEAKLVELNKRLIDEFQDREAKARAVEEDLRAQASTLAASAADLARDYEVKAAELEAVKQKILAELRGPGENTK